MATHDTRTESPDTLRAGWVGLLAVLAAGLVLRLWLAFTDDGLYWPDEIYQSLEPAHRLVWGYGLVPWEFARGARSWAFPGLIAGLLKLGTWVGLDAPRGYLGLVRVAFCLVGVATALGAFRLARVLGSSVAGGLAAAALFALPAPALYFAPRALSETASALPVVWGFALCLEPRASPLRRWTGASLMGLATLLRLQNGLLCVALLLMLAVQGLRLRLSDGKLSLRPTLEVAAVLLLWALLYGALDRLTWGGWFHSALTYFRFNILEDKSAQWGVSDAAYYLRVLWTSAPLPTLCFLLLAAAGARRAPGLLATALLFLAVHSTIPHKELRFLLPALPLIAAVAGLGVDVFTSTHRRWLLTAAVLVACTLSAARVRRLTFGELGAYESTRPHRSAFDDSGPVNRLLLAAHAQPDLCGLKVEAVHLAWTGGHTYLHRAVPLYPHTGPSRDSRLFNFVITPAWAAGPGAEVRARESGLVLAQLPGEGCATDSHYGWRLP
ncbi:MAG: hypothetical protein L0Y66_21220 [Myxococcaceae bacterium]|nr:hypothetical protein [Myxococcaceae bacterium]MCI0670825.1 hypothetical protein [Myxococcaceae bacterium]